MFLAITQKWINSYWKCAPVLKVKTICKPGKMILKWAPLYICRPGKHLPNTCSVCQGMLDLPVTNHLNSHFLSIFWSLASCIARVRSHANWKNSISRFSHPNPFPSFVLPVPKSLFLHSHVVPFHHYSSPAASYFTLLICHSSFH